MFAEVHCSCEGSFQVDSEWDESVWMMLYRFADAHVSCGYMTERSDGEAQVLAAGGAKTPAAEADGEPED